MENFNTSSLHLPCSTVEIFRRRFSGALNDHSKINAPTLRKLDPSLYIFLLPKLWSDEYESQSDRKKAIDYSLLSIRQQTREFLLFTWDNVKQFKPDNASELSWCDSNLASDGKGIIFFIDFDSIRLYVESALKKKKILTKASASGLKINISDGCFEEEICLNKIVSKCLFEGSGPLEASKTLVNKIVTRFALYHKIIRGLNKYFPQAKILIEGNYINIHNKRVRGKIKYRNLADGIILSKTTPNTLFRNIALQDIINVAKGALLLVRSPLYLKARPKALHRQKDSYLIVSNQYYQKRIKKIESQGENDRARMKFYQLNHWRDCIQHCFEVNCFCINESDGFAIGLIGDHAASLILYPEILAKAVKQFNKSINNFRFIAKSENCAILVSHLCDEKIIKIASDRTNMLSNLLYEEGSDPLDMDIAIKIPGETRDKIAIKEIDVVFFELMEYASNKQHLFSPGKSDYLKGLAFELINQNEKAINHFRKAYLQDSSDAEYNHVLGRAIAEKGNCKKAIPFLMKAYQSMPGDIEVANTYGMVQMLLGYPQEAIKTFERAIETDPDDIKSLLNLSRGYIGLDKYHKAKNVLMKINKQDPSIKEVHLMLSYIYKKTNDITKSRLHANQALDIENEQNDVHLVLKALKNKN